MRLSNVIFYFCILSSSSAWGFGEVQFGASLGQSSSQIENSDGSQAHYDGLAFSGEFGLSLVRTNAFTSLLNFKLNYLDLENRANSGQQRESGRHLGVSAGLKLKYHRFVGGYDYGLVEAKHYWVGDETNQYKKFEFTKAGWFAGLEFQISKSTYAGFIYSDQVASIPKAELGSERDQKFLDRTIWLTIQISTNETLGDFFRTIFKN